VRPCFPARSERGCPQPGRARRRSGGFRPAAGSLKQSACPA